MRFRALDPRKQKRARVEATLAGLGTLIWHALPPLSLRDFPETRMRAEEALAGAIRTPKGTIGAGFKRRLFEWQYNGSRRLFERHTDDIAVAWNGLNGSRYAYMAGARDAGARCLYFELAPFPDCITVDPMGVNFRNHLPREIGSYLKWFNASGLAPDGWRAKGRKIRQRPALADKTSSGKGKLPPVSEPFVFVPLQVPGDSQIRLFGRAYGTVPDFIAGLGRIASSLPPGWHLRLKEHPSAKVSHAGQFEAFDGLPIHLDNHSDTFDLVRSSRAVLTVNSSVGLEAMFFDKPVIAAGDCFWALEGVAHAARDEVELAGLLSRANMLGFDQTARDAFLTYLTERYYIALGKDGDAYRLADGEAEKIRLRIEARQGVLDVEA